MFNPPPKKKKKKYGRARKINSMVENTKFINVFISDFGEQCAMTFLSCKLKLLAYLSGNYCNLCNQQPVQSCKIVMKDYYLA